MKKGRQIDNDIGGKRSGAGGMKDMEARIVEDDVSYPMQNRRLML